MERFFAAARRGDMQGLLELLTDDATLWSDGGGKVAAAINPIYGAGKIARFFAGIARTLPATLTLRAAVVNGQPGMITYVEGRPQNVITTEIEHGKIRAIRLVVNPDKLRAVPPLDG